MLPATSDVTPATAHVTAGIPLPKQWVVSGFPAPSIPEGERPWNKNKGMDDPAFMKECEGWDVNKVVFTPQNWAVYESLMRDDFTLFDSYDYKPASAKFEMPIMAWFATKDKKVMQAHMQGWAAFSTMGFELVPLEGAKHLFFYDAEHRSKFMADVIAHLPATV